MGLTVLSVGYPFAPVGPDPVGGAEQVLSRLDRALVAAGHRSIVIAPAGSFCAGEQVDLPVVRGEIGDEARAVLHAAVRERIGSVLACERVDVIHLHGIDFHAYLPDPGPAVLVTLHLPLDWYPPPALAAQRPRTWLHPVSASQARGAPLGCALAPPIGNGVEIATTIGRKGRFALALGRLCPEKGFEDALDAARLAGVPLLLAGQAFPYPDHLRYLAEEILPRLDGTRRWIGPVAGARKRRLLARACALLVPSKVPETASLVAMEALATGTPVIAYRQGALPEVVEDGRTGFLVDDTAQMAAAIGAVRHLDPELCRRSAAERFPLERMTSRYLARYAEVAAA